VRHIAALLALALVGLACGDPAFDPGETITNGSPAGSTTIAGTVQANVSGEQFLGRLSSGATFRNERLSFNAYDGNTRQIAISVRAPGPGTYEVSGPYTPNASLIEGFGPDVRRWASLTTPGSGSVTITFFSAETAIGYFSFYLLPDSATVASGVVTPRSLTSGTFTVTMAR
jgi:hypothetical protein